MVAHPNKIREYPRADIVAAVARLDRDARRRVIDMKRGPPVLVMHWVEVPGGRCACHYDIEIPQLDGSGSLAGQPRP